jgi:putative addiction module component (TIGR02574 family)
MGNAESAPTGLSTTAERLLHDALALPAEDRARLADALAESVDQLGPPDLGPEWEAEIARRLDALDSGRTKTIPWEQAERMIFGADDDSTKKG